MAFTNVIDPTQMTIQQRRVEVASILALGLIRLRTAPEPATQEKEKKPLGFTAHQSVHTNPVSRVRKAQQQGV